MPKFTLANLPWKVQLAVFVVLSAAAAGAGCSIPAIWNLPLIVKLISSGPSFCPACTWLSTISTGRWKYRVASRLPTKSDSDASDVLRPSMVRS